MEPESPLSKALELSLKTPQQDFPVVKDGKLLGILTRHNLISSIHQYGKDKKVNEIISKKIVTARLSESLNSVYGKMVNNNTKVVVILQEKHLQGIITLEDIARIYSIESDKNNHR